MAQDQVQKRVTRLEANIMLCISAAICMTALIISEIGVPSLAFWGNTTITSTRTDIITISAFGTLVRVSWTGEITLTSGLVGNYLPGVAIFAGMLMVLASIKFKKISIAGAILAIAGPLIFIAMLATYNIAFLQGDSVFGIQDLISLSYGSNLLSGFVQEPTYTMTWSLGASAYMPLGAGALAIFASIYGRLT